MTLFARHHFIFLIFIPFFLCSNLWGQESTYSSSPLCQHDIYTGPHIFLNNSFLNLQSSLFSGFIQEPNLTCFSTENKPSRGIELIESENFQTELNLQGEFDLDLSYGSDFSLKRGVITGAGSEGITEGLRYSLIERILLTGSVGDRFFLKFDYDSERSEEGVIEEENIYSVLYKGKEKEFLQEASLGNKYQSVEGSRYVPVDQGNPSSFALRGRAGWEKLYFEGLFRYDVALSGQKNFKGQKKEVVESFFDVDYVKARFFFLPDENIDEGTLLVYRSTSSISDISIDGKSFVLLGRTTDYDFNNSTGYIYLAEPLGAEEELCVYYQKGGSEVGSDVLGSDAIINTSGAREDFNTSNYTDYFGQDASGKNYLYLKKKAFNSYWELRNGYYLEELENDSAFNFSVELHYTSNGGINSNYDDILNNYEIDGSRRVIFFKFKDDQDLFYPRPFPGVTPYPSTNPFVPSNPVYGGISYPTSESSINKINVSYSFYTDTFFLDFNIVPGSVEVKVDGRIIQPEYYDVDYKFGIITFKEGLIGPASEINITYRYTAFGGGDKALLGILGIHYTGDFLQAKNLTSYRAPIKKGEAPHAGYEGEGVLTNATEVNLNFGSDDEEGFYSNLEAGAAFSRTNPNVYGCLIIADMESEEYSEIINLNDSEWIIGSKSQILTAYPYNLTMNSRGNILYKNYWRKTTFSGDVLEELDWELPSDHLFSYSEKAGPYNTADKPQNGEDQSLVIDYQFNGGSSGSYVSLVTPIAQLDLSWFQQFNIILKGEDISGSNVRIYVEVLKNYQEDLDGDDQLDGESSINDAGFEITPLDGEKTLIGTNRYGNSNGKIESEDINKNGYLDSDIEEGVVITDNSGKEIPTGDGNWEYLSFDITDLIESNKEFFQYMSALRITLKVDSTPASGKLLINKMWFSGAEVVNNNPEIISISEVTVNEDPVVNQNAFSKAYPATYEKLHGSATYRERVEHVEKTLRVLLKEGNLTSSTISRKFLQPLNFTVYRNLRMYVYIPQGTSFPAELYFTLSLISSQNQSLDVDIPSSIFRTGWNEIKVELFSPYEVFVNGNPSVNMKRTGTLFILKRISEVRYGLKMQTGSWTIPAGTEIWLDEFHLEGTEKYVDYAYFIQGKVGYRGLLVSIGDFPILSDTSIKAGYEEKRGIFQNDLDYKSTSYFGGGELGLLSYLGADIIISKENTAPIRNIENLPGGFDLESSSTRITNELEFDSKIAYLPILKHSFNYTQSKQGVVQLTDTDYQYSSVSDYESAFAINALFDFPFGLLYSYSFTRDWIYSMSSIVYPETSFDFTTRIEAFLNQIQEMQLSYNADIFTWSIYLNRDQLFGGASVPGSTELLSSYRHSISTIFFNPRDTIEEAYLSAKKDGIELIFDVPLKNTFGFNFHFNTVYNESNVRQDVGKRDILTNNDFTLTIPFRVFGENGMEVQPGMGRGFDGNYKEIPNKTDEGEILLDMYRYLFKPPFYYISPFESLGREKDYDAVDIFSEESTENTFTTRYFLNILFPYENWYIPSNLGLNLEGETEREGATYIQKRNVEVTAGKNFILGKKKDVYDYSLSLQFTYEHGRNYTTKVLGNTFEFETGFDFLKSSSRGFQLDHSFTYERERQKIDEPSLYLFPGESENEIEVPYKPYRDTLKNSVVFEYLWEYNIKKSGLFPSFFLNIQQEGFIKNSEIIKLENIYTFTDRERAGSFNNIPLRLTLEHKSSYSLTDKVQFGMNLATVVGIEERVAPPSTEGSILPSIGFETGISIKIIF